MYLVILFIYINQYNTICVKGYNDGTLHDTSF